jgi:hypothetical protein
MSRRIAQFVSESERTITHLIKELEAKNGYPSHDARHWAENAQKTRLKMIDLGLDPNDTTPQELYHALIAKFDQDRRRFEQFFDVTQAGFDQMSTTAVKLVLTNLDLPEQWALKSKIAKQALKNNPPKKLIKHLGYRSLDSMLKRENIFELFIATQALESKSWHKDLSKYISSLDQTDYEMRPVKLVALNEEKWSTASPPEDLAVYDSRVGATAIWPSRAVKSAPLLTMILILVESFAQAIDIRPGPELVKMNMVMWWVDMDHLVAELSGEHVSLNLKDCALNLWQQNDYADRILEHGRKSFWQELISRYQNRPAEEEPFDDSVRDRIANLKLAVPEPAAQFAEEFDG